MKQDFSSKQKETMMRIINECLDSVTIEQCRAYIMQCVVFCEYYRTGHAPDEIVNKMKELRKIRKKHRTGVPLLQIFREQMMGNDSSNTNTSSSNDAEAIMEPQTEETVQSVRRRRRRGRRDWDNE